MDSSLFARDQKRIVGLVPWREGAVTRSSPFMLVDATQPNAAPLSIPGCGLVLDVASDGRRDLAVCRQDGGGLVVFDRDDHGVRMHVLSKAASTDDGKVAFRVAADGATLVVWEQTRIHVKTGDAPFRTTPVAPPPSPPRGVPVHALAAKGRLYLGYAAGEWGGALVSMDLGTGVARVEPGSEMTDQPVTGLTLDPTGKVWVTRGQSHLGANQGALHVLDGETWRLVAGSPGSWSQSKLPAGEWNLGATAFEGVAFDAEGTLHLLSGSLGLVRREPAGGFVRLTPQWPSWVYVDGLIIRGEKALIGTFDAGVLVFDMKRGTTARVSLGPG